MKFKRIFSIVLVTIMCVSTVFAEPLRVKYRNVKSVSRENPNDIYFEEFAGVAPGIIPGDVTVANLYGYVTTEKHNVGEIEKNCAVLVDTSHTKNYDGPKMYFTFPTQNSGVIGIEIRYKYIAEQGSQWNAAIFQAMGKNGKLSRNVYGSANGVLINDKNEPIEPAQIQSDNWYTLKWIIDFENKAIDFRVLNEGKNKEYSSLNNDFSSADVDDINSFYMDLQVYGGRWIVDYFRVSDLSEVEGIRNSITKGSAQPEMIDAPISKAVKNRTNIKVDNIYQFTTKAPKISGGEVLVTAKNISSMFDIQYYRAVSGFILKGNEAEFVIKADGSGISKDGDDLTLSTSCIVEGNQIFVPIKDIANALDYEYSYDADENIVTIMTQKISE